MPISLSKKYLLMMAGEAWPPAGVDLVWLYMDFLNADGPPATTPRTAALDGSARSAGAITLDQTDGEYSTTGGNLVIPAQTTPVWGDQGYWDATARSRAAGVALLQRFTVGTWEEYGFGWDTTAGDDDPDNFEHAIQLNTTDGTLEDETGETLITGLSVATEYAVALILRTTGAFYYLQSGSTWELLKVSDTGVTASVYPVTANLDAVLTVDKLAGVDLNTSVLAVYPAPVLSDSFSDASDPYISDGWGHNEGKRKGQTATADVTGALVASDFAATYENYVPLNDTGDGGVFDPVNESYVQLPADEFEGAGWDDATGGLVIKFAFDDAAPAVSQRILTVGADGSNRIIVQKQTIGGLVTASYYAGGTIESVDFAGLNANTIYCIGVMWAGGSVRFYIDGVEQGTAQAIGGTWAGLLKDNYCVIGAATATPAIPHNGTITETVISFNLAPSDAQMIALTNQSNALTSAFLDTNIGSGKYARYGLDDAPIGARLGDGKSLLSGTWSSDGITARSNAVVPADKTTLAENVTIEYPRTQAAITIDDTEEAGVIMRNHQVKVCRNDSTGDELRIYDIANTTQLSATAITYNDGAELQAAYMSDGKVRADYDGAFVVAQSVTVDANEQDVGLYADDLFGTAATVWSVNAQNYGRIV